MLLSIFETSQKYPGIFIARFHQSLTIALDRMEVHKIGMQRLQKEFGFGLNQLLKFFDLFKSNLIAKDRSDKYAE